MAETQKSRESRSLPTPRFPERDHPQGLIEVCQLPTEGSRLSSRGHQVSTLVPCLGSPDNITFPPCQSMTRFTMESPRPVPNFSSVLALLARKNSSKIFVCCLGGMPIPSSWTVKTSQFSAALNSTTTWLFPAGVYLIALERILSATRSKASRSALKCT